MPGFLWGREWTEVARRWVEGGVRLRIWGFGWKSWSIGIVRADRTPTTEDEGGESHG